MRRRADKGDSSSSSSSSSSRLIKNTWVRQLPRKMGALCGVAPAPVWSLIVVPFRSFGP